MTRDRGREARRQNAGFSLLEVLGAIAIIGIWFSIIAEIAMVGLRNEGRSQRALMASLVVDDILSDFEIDMLSGKFPELTDQETEEDGYTIRIEVEPYPLELPEPIHPPRGASPYPGGAAFQNLRGGAPDAPNPLVSIRIEVAWIEGNHEASVVRHTFGVDRSQAEEELATLEGRPSRRRGSDDGGDEDDNLGSL